MIKRLVPVLISALIYSAAYAQLTFSSKQAISLTPEQKRKISTIIHKGANEELSDIVISNSVLQTIHEYGDYGPYNDGQSLIVNKGGVSIEYKITKKVSGYVFGDSNNGHCDETCYTYFIPDGVSKVYYSYTMKYGFPPSFGGAAEISEITDWQRKILKVIKK